MSEDKIQTVRLTTHRYVLEILRRLQHGTARFTDLKEACPSERLRSIRLADLMETGLVEKQAIGEGNDLQIVYKLTPRGKRLVLEMERLLEKI